MRVGLVVLSALAACQPASEEWPVIPGGGSPVSNPTLGVDAAVDAADGGTATTLTGRVCLVTDARALTTCADTGAGGLTVLLESATATTSDDGAFTIDAPTSLEPVWFVTGADIVPSAMRVGTSHQIPVIPASLETALVNAHSVVFPAAEEGMIFVRAESAGAPAVGLTATVVPASTYPPLYDDLTPLAWSPDQTGASGTVWLPGVPAGTASVQLVPNGGTPVTIAAPVFEATNTFATVTLP